jgi:hypothetical protein
MKSVDLKRDPAELRELLVFHARALRAPAGARQRVLAGVSAAGIAVALTGAAEAGATAAGVSVPLLVGKWAGMGLITTLLGVGVVEGGQRLFEPRAATLGAPVSTSISARPIAVALAPPAAPVAEVRETGIDPGVSPGSILPRPVPPVVAPGAAALEPVASSALSAAQAPTEDPATDSLRREVATLKRARAALAASHPASAATVLDEYARAFPRGVLHAEAAALRVELAAELREAALARSLGSQFLIDYPNSALAARVRRVAGLP